MRVSSSHNPFEAEGDDGAEIKFTAEIKLGAQVDDSLGFDTGYDDDGSEKSGQEE